jgi:hypothetical protein
MAVGAQRRVDRWNLELSIGANYLGHGALSDAFAGTLRPETSIS